MAELRPGLHTMAATRWRDTLTVTVKTRRATRLTDAAQQNASPSLTIAEIPKRMDRIDSAGRGVRGHGKIKFGGAARRCAPGRRAHDPWVTRPVETPDRVIPNVVGVSGALQIGVKLIEDPLTGAIGGHRCASKWISPPTYRQIARFVFSIGDTYRVGRITL